MLFSILIAHYNNFDYFLECYKSIQEQTYAHIEIVLVDDCSTDGSQEKLQALADQDSRIRLFYNEENKGVGYTKHRCAALAQGEMAAFTDPDDALMPDAVQTMVNALNADKNAVAAYSQLYLSREKLQPGKVFDKTRRIKNGKPLFFNLNFEVAHLFVFRIKDYKRTEGINPELSSAVDQDLYLKMYETGDFLYIEQPLYLYRLHEKGVSQQSNKKEKLNKNWDRVLRDTLLRRNLDTIYGKKIAEISSLQHYVIQKQNTFFSKILRKLS